MVATSYRPASSNAVAPRPARFPVLAENIPAELREKRRHVGWRWELRGDKWTKPPINVATGQYASSTNPATWATFDAAHDAYERGDVEGVGIVLGDGIIGIDLDKCRDPDTGEIRPWAPEQRAQFPAGVPDPAEIIARLGTYAEVSPSGSGVKLAIRGALPVACGKKGSLEAYDEKRYFTLTGHRLEVAPPTLASAGDELATILTMFGFTPRQSSTAVDRVSQVAPSPRPPIDDDDENYALGIEEILLECHGDEFNALFRGDTSAYDGDHSRADQRLCGIIARKCRYFDLERWHVEQYVNRIFRRSGLYRDKWHRPARNGETYGQGTVRIAVDDAFAERTVERREPHRLGDVEVTAGAPRRTATKLIVPLAIRAGGQIIDTLQLTSADSARKSAAKRLVSHAGGDVAEADKLLGRVLVEAEASTAAAPKVDGATIHEILASKIPPRLALAHLTSAGKAYSEALGCEIGRSAFVERFTCPEMLELVAAAADAPRDEFGGIVRPNLIRALEQELRLLWGGLTIGLKRADETDDDASDSHAAEDFRAAMTALWNKMGNMGMLTHRGADGRDHDFAARRSLVSRLRELPIRDTEWLRVESMRGWKEIQRGYAALWRVIFDGDKPVILLAMRPELVGQIGAQPLPGVKTLGSLTRLCRKYKLLDEGDTPSIVTGGHHITVLHRDYVAELLLAMPMEGDR